MNQNYNAPLFVYNGSLEPDDFENEFESKFKEAYPSTKEARLFAYGGGRIIIESVTDDDLTYLFNLMAIDTLISTDSGSLTITFNFTPPGEDPVTITVIYEGAGD